MRDRRVRGEGADGGPLRGDGRASGDFAGFELARRPAGRPDELRIDELRE
ncbi:hypothetical protein [Streptomyces sp. SM11]|nr:hypothetical protein [Streptomyces sp. SM11]